MTSNNSLYFLGAAVVGIVSAAGLFIAEHFRQERRRHAMAQDLARLDQQLSGMRKELEQLRLLQKDRSTQRARKARRTKEAAYESASEDYSTVDGESSDLEFYDLSEEENDAATVTAVEQELKDIDDKLNSGDELLTQKALDSLRELSDESPSNPELLWRLGKAHHKLSCFESAPAAKLELLKQGQAACERSLALSDDAAEAHKWMAILVGAQISDAPLRQKVAGGCLFKEHLDRALQLDPDDPTLHHMLGKFAYETAGLKWYERQIVDTLFAAFPRATYPEALDYALNAERLLARDWKENKLLVAKCQIALGQHNEGVKALVVANDMVDKTCLDPTVEAEVKTLLAKYNAYR